MKQFTDEEMNAANAELKKVRDRWLRRPGVTAVDVGYKIQNGRLIDVLAIRVHVKRKLSPNQLNDDELFPTRLGDFPVDIIEAEYGPQSA